LVDFGVIEVAGERAGGGGCGAIEEEEGRILLIQVEAKLEFYCTGKGHCNGRGKEKKEKKKKKRQK
jgi:hypothetical protein